jgi:hypothetical protein
VQAVVIKERLIKTPKDRLSSRKDLVRGRMTNLSVTLRAQTQADNLVAGFTDFVDDRYYSGSEVSQAA